MAKRVVSSNRIGWVEAVRTVGENILSELDENNLRGRLRYAPGFGGTIGEPSPYRYFYTIKSGSRFNPFAIKVARVIGLSHDASEKEGFYQTPGDQEVIVYDNAKLPKVRSIVERLNARYCLGFVVKSAAEKKVEDLRLASR